jgi:hypothetical protein
VEDSDDALFTCHTFFVFFGGDEVGEALAGVFSISVCFPLGLVDWLRLLGLVVLVECFLLGFGWGHLIFLHKVRKFSIDHLYL